MGVEGVEPVRSRSDRLKQSGTAMTNKQTDRLTDRQTDRLTDRLRELSL